jgi:hypothetical protein
MGLVSQEEDKETMKYAMSQISFCEEKLAFAPRLPGIQSFRIHRLAPGTTG